MLHGYTSIISLDDAAVAAYPQASVNDDDTP
jgi:hypothetical protein